MAYQLPHEDDIRAFLTTPPPQPDWVIEGLEPGDVGIISAPGGTGKSMFCLSVGIGVASGAAIFGQWDVDQAGDVLYIYAEDQPATVHRRLYALGQKSPVEAAAIDRIHAICVRTSPPKLMIRGTDRNGLAEWQTEILTGITTEVMRYAHPRLIILDPLIKFHALDENSNTDMEQFMSLMTRTATELGVAIIITHHVGKSAVLNGQSSIQQSARGASAIVDQARWQVTLSPLDDKSAGKLSIPEADCWQYLVASCPKINGAAKLPDLILHRGPDGVLMASGLTMPAVKPPSKSKAKRDPVNIDQYMGRTN